MREGFHRWPGTVFLIAIAVFHVLATQSTASAQSSNVASGLSDPFG